MLSVVTQMFWDCGQIKVSLTILAGFETEHLPHRYQSDPLCKAYTFRKKALFKNYTQIMRNSIPVCAVSPHVLAELY